MNRFFTLILLTILFRPITVAQPPSNGTRQPVITKSLDSFSLRPAKNLQWLIDPASTFLSPSFHGKGIRHDPSLDRGTKNSDLPPSTIRTAKNKDVLFYVLCVLFILFALLKRTFPKYFVDLFSLVFRTTLKHRQVREQLIQTPLPALLLNVFFAVVAGFYIGFLVEYKQANPVQNFWLLVLYCSIGITALYTIKFIGLKFSGWLFNMEQAAGSYIFIVFIINKMLGIMLLPFLALLAFTTGDIFSSSITLSWILVGSLVIYRFILTYAAIRNEVKVNPFHFFLYLLAFEIAPLILVYKGLLFFFRITA